MTRPRLYDEPRVTTAVRLPVSLREQLVTAASARDVSVNLLVTQAVAAYLRQLTPLDAVGTGPAARASANTRRQADATGR